MNIQLHVAKLLAWLGFKCERRAERIAVRFFGLDFAQIDRGEIFVICKNCDGDAFQPGVGLCEECHGTAQVKI